MRQRTIVTFVLAITIVGCAKNPNTLVTDGYDQTEMDAAIARARREIDSFINELRQGNGTGFAVKAPIEDQGVTEHFWVTNVVFRNGEFTGRIDNEPGMVSNVKIGQEWTIKSSEISDWMFVRDGKIHGNYTMRPLLKTLPREEADQLRARLAEP